MFHVVYYKTVHEWHQNHCGYNQAMTTGLTVTTFIEESALLKQKKV